jgi:alpha-beta hydrolase superfamily lysophospholipase
MKHADGTLTSADKTRLYYQSWSPDGEPAAVMAMVHGTPGHGGMMHNYGESLAPGGIAVYALDLRGHGKSDGPRGYVNSWSDFRADLGALLAMIRGRHAGLPQFVMGHSMGAVVVLDSVLRAPDGIAGAIATAAALGKLSIPSYQFTMARVLSRLAPRSGMPLDNDHSHSLRDPGMIAVYQADPLRFQKGTFRLAVEFMDAVDRVNAHAGDLHLPLLMLHGGADILASPEGSRAFFEKVPGPDKEYKEYPGALHELHNDFGWQEVMADVAGWLERQLAQSAAKS